MKLLKVALGAVASMVVGFAAGVLFAPRSGAESRAMASDAVNDAWDSAIDTYERGQQAVSEKFDSMRPSVDATSDELRAKVDLARERMDQLRDSLNNAAAAEAAEPVVAEDEEVETDSAVAEDEVAEAEKSTEVVFEETADEDAAQE